MKFRYTPLEERKCQLRSKHANMHKWFAWYPVYIGGGEWRWLEVVYRQKPIGCIDFLYYSVETIEDREDEQDVSS